MSTVTASIFLEDGDTCNLVEHESGVLWLSVGIGGTIHLPDDAETRRKLAYQFIDIGSRLLSVAKKEPGTLSPEDAAAIESLPF